MEIIDNYCVDCKCWTKQKFHHTNHVDGDMVYICEICGCENSVFPVSQEEFNKAMDKAIEIIKS